jgi:hypothetical protein
MARLTAVVQALQQQLRQAQLQAVAHQAVSQQVALLAFFWCSFSFSLLIKFVRSRWFFPA